MSILGFKLTVIKLRHKARSELKTMPADVCRTGGVLGQEVR